MYLSVEGSRLEKGGFRIELGQDGKRWCFFKGFRMDAMRDKTSWGFGQEVSEPGTGSPNNQLSGTWTSSRSERDAQMAERLRGSKTGGLGWEQTNAQSGRRDTASHSIGDSQETISAWPRGSRLTQKRERGHNGWPRVKATRLESKLPREGSVTCRCVGLSLSLSSSERHTFMLV